MKTIRIVGLTTCLVLVSFLLVRSFTADAALGLGKWQDDGTRIVMVSTNDGPTVTISTNRQILIGGYWFTNLVISNSFKGTIQIGTNFWRVDEIGVKIDCAQHGHRPYPTRCVWIGAKGPVEGPCFKCAICGKELTQQPGEWK